MSTLLIKGKAPDQQGRIISVTPQSAGWDYVGFEVFKLHDGQAIKGNSGAFEICLVVLAGHGNIKVDGQAFNGLGTRTSVFDPIAPDAVYLPPGLDYAVTATGDLELGVCKAPGTGTYPVRRIPTDRMSMEKCGKGNNIRHVCNILPETEPADSLLVVEVITPAGNASSYPPHKHDQDYLPQESLLVETYYHRLEPSQGFAFQRVYTDDRTLDETMTIENGDVVLVPRGYHPVATVHGYDLYYLNVMAGPKRAWQFYNDPQHQWILES